MKFISPFLLAVFVMTSCATSPEELQYRMDKKEERFDKRQEMMAIRAESFDRRLNKMSSNADQRYSNSYGRLMND